MALTVLLPGNDYSAPLRALLEPMLPPGSTVRSPDDGLVRATTKHPAR